MSMDIRSFFAKKGSTGSSSNKQKESESKTSKKRTLRVIESDDDDDVMIFEKPTKKHKESKSENTSPPKKKKSVISPKNEKPKENASVNISNFFGTSPVQQKKQEIKKCDKVPIQEEKPKEKHKSSKKNKKESHRLNQSYSIECDDGFDETFSQINESELEGLTREKSKSPKKKPAEIKKTPVKSPDVKVKTPGSVDGKKGSQLNSEQKRKNAESYQRYLNRSGPKNPGSKTIPKGKPNCLQGLTFVISGVLDSMEREEATELIQKYSGRVTNSISKKTDFIVLGEEPGLSKLKKAEELGTKKLTEDELLNLIRTKSADDEESCSSQENFIEGTPTKSVYFSGEKTKRSGECSKASPSNKKARRMLEVEAPKTFLKKKAETGDTGYETMESQDSGSITEPAEELLWVDKYAPKATKNIIGQGGDKSNVKKLIHWLRNWHKNNDRTGGKRPPPWQNQDGTGFKAALLSGPPGVGKTTSVHLVCKELGFDVIEFNSSDTRKKKQVEELPKMFTSTKPIRKFLDGGDNSLTRHVLVMDEVDGMSNAEDRGGIAELIQVIKETKVPVICMCNDRSSPSIRSLVNYCYDLRYSKPRVEQIKAAMMSVCFKEKVKITGEALEELIINANQDVRQVLHNLSLWATKDKSLDAETAKKASEQAKKALKLGPWDVARKVFSASEHSNMSLRDKTDLFFQDYEMGPLFVQDLYTRVKPQKAKNDKKETLNLLSKTADSILMGDVVNNSIRKNNNWTLLPVQAIFSSVLPGHYMEGYVQGQIQFPVWFGKNSKAKRFQRLLLDLQHHMRLRISGDKEAVNLDYLQVLKDAIVLPLIQSGSDGVSDTLKVMSDYNLTKDDLDAVMELSLWPGRKDDYASLDSKVKAALTRAYNKEGRAVPYAVTGNFKKVKNVDTEFGDEEEEDEETEEADDINSDAMIKKGKPKTKPAETKRSKPEKAAPKEKKKKK